MTPYASGKRWVLYGGDCLDVLPTIEPAALVFADPPFGVNHTGHGKSKAGPARKFAPIVGDDAVRTDWLAALQIAERGALYLKTDWRVLRLWEDAVAAICAIRNRIVWDKRSHTGGDLVGGYAHRTEIILYAARDGHTMRGHDVDLWEIPRCNVGWLNRESDHPNESPVALPARAIANATDPDDLVVDPFTGSGTAGVAALRAGRRFIGCEIDPAHLPIAARRLAQAEADGVQSPLFAAGA